MIRLFISVSIDSGVVRCWSSEWCRLVVIVGLGDILMGKWMSVVYGEWCGCVLGGDV